MTLANCEGVADPGLEAPSQPPRPPPLLLDVASPPAGVCHSILRARRRSRPVRRGARRLTPCGAAVLLDARRVVYRLSDGVALRPVTSSLSRLSIASLVARRPQSRGTTDTYSANILPHRPCLSTRSLTMPSATPTLPPSFAAATTDTAFAAAAAADLMMDASCDSGSGHGCG